MKIKVNISAEMPSHIKEENKYKDLHDKVIDYMEVCESDEDSEYHWNYLKCLFKKLREKKSLPNEYMRLMDDLVQFMIKYGEYDSGDNQVDLEGTEIFKYKTDDKEEY